MQAAPRETPEILILDGLRPEVVDDLSVRFHAHCVAAGECDAVLAQVGPRIRGVASSAHASVDGALFDRLPRLEIVSNFGVGYDNVDVHEAARRGILVTNTPDVLSDEVADLALGLLLATVRRIPQADRFLREGHWPTRNYPLTATLRERRVGILGLGRIGRAIAARLEGFRVEIHYHGRRRYEGVPYAFHDTLTGMAHAIDVLIVAAPGGPETRGIVDAGVLEALGPEGIVMNIARGSLIDEPALIQALRSGRLHGAGLDVFASEPHVPAALVALDNVVLLPHVGSGSVHTRRMMAKLLIDNMTSWFSGKGPLTPVPETPTPRSGRP